MKRRMTNVEKITHMMEHSEYGALKQGFMIQALEEYAKLVSEADLSEFANGFIPGEVWVGIANEVLTELHTEMTTYDEDYSDDEID